MAMDEKTRDLLNRGILLMKLEKYAEAKEHFQRMIETEPECLDAYIHLGNALVNLGELDEAVRAFSSALILDGSSGEVLFNIANVYYLKDDSKNAIKYYVKAEKAGFRSGDMYMIMGDVFYRSGDVAQALRCVTHAVKEAPLRGELWRQKIILELELGKVESALDSLDEFEDLLPDALDIHELRTRILLELGRYDEAREHLERAIERFPADLRLQMLLLHLRIESGDIDTALAQIAELKVNKLEPSVQKRIALEEAGIYLKKEDAAMAVKSIEWGLEANPDDSELQFIILNTHIAALDYQKNIEYADQVLQHDNLEPSIYAAASFYRALSLRETGHADEANAIFKELKQKLRSITIDNPENVDVFVYRLLNHCALKEYDEAFELADYLGQILPHKEEAHSFRALIYKDMGDKAKEAEELAKASSMKKEHKEQ